MRAVYKCRLCGETYTAGGNTDANVAEHVMLCMNTGIVCTVPLAPRKTETHHCGGPRAGCLGLADFQGWEKEG